MENKRFKRILCAMLASVMAAAMTACGEESTETESAAGSTSAETTTVVEEETDPYDALRGLDYDGYTFQSITYQADNWFCYLVPEEDTGDILNDAAFRRNQEVEEMLNVAITVYYGGYESEIEDFRETYKRLILAGDPTCPELLVFSASGERISFILENMAYDWQELPIMRLESPWYNQTANDAYNIAGKQYYAVSDYTFPVQQRPAILFNKDMATEFQIEFPYDHVFDGTWTMDILMEMCKDIYSDLNGNGKSDEDDRFGIALWYPMSSYFVLNAGEIIMETGRNGFETNLYSNRIVDIVDTVTAFQSTQDVYTESQKLEIFSKGNILFFPYAADPAFLRDVENFDFGYLPFPKYNDEQEDYVVLTTGGMMAVSPLIEDPARTGAIIEALSLGSHRYMKDAFSDAYFEGKVLRDEQSQEIYRMMQEKATYDLSANLDPSGLCSGWYNTIFQNNEGIASYYAANGEAVKNAYGALWQEITGQ